MTVSVCLSVCMYFVFLSVGQHISGNRSPNSCACYPWPWIGAPATLADTLLNTSSFVDDVAFSHKGQEYVSK